MEIAAGVAKRRFAQSHETGDIPFFQKRLVGVQKDRKIEEIRHEGDHLVFARKTVGQEHIETFDNQDVRSVHGYGLARHHVVDEMRIDRGDHIALARLDVRQEANERAAIVAFGKALALHQALANESGVGVQKAVGGDEFDFGRIGPSRQQRLENAGGRRLAHRHRACNADDIGHLAVVGAEKALRRLEQALRRGDIKGEQARQRQIDRNDFLERNRLVHRLQLAQILDGQGQLCVGAQLRPFLAAETAKRGGDGLSGWRRCRIAHAELKTSNAASQVRRNSGFCANSGSGRVLQGLREAFSSWPERAVRRSSSPTTASRGISRALSTTSRW